MVAFGLLSSSHHTNDIVTKQSIVRVECLQHGCPCCRHSTVSFSLYHTTLSYAVITERLPSSAKLNIVPFCASPRQSKCGHDSYDIIATTYRTSWFAASSEVGGSVFCQCIWESSSYYGLEDFLTTGLTYFLQESLSTGSIVYNYYKNCWDLDFYTQPLGCSSHRKLRAARPLVLDPPCPRRGVQGATVLVRVWRLARRTRAPVWVTPGVTACHCRAEPPVATSRLVSAPVHE